MEENAVSDFTADFDSTAPAPLGRRWRLFPAIQRVVIVSPLEVARIGVPETLSLPV